MVDPPRAGMHPSVKSRSTSEQEFDNVIVNNRNEIRPQRRYTDRRAGILGRRRELGLRSESNRYHSHSSRRYDEQPRRDFGYDAGSEARRQEGRHAVGSCELLSKESVPLAGDLPPQYRHRKGSALDLPRR